MFTESDITSLKCSKYSIFQLNHHDVTIHSTITGHDWIIVSSYGAAVQQIVISYIGIPGDILFIGKREPINPSKMLLCILINMRTGM